MQILIPGGLQWSENISTLFPVYPTSELRCQYSQCRRCCEEGFSSPRTGESSIGFQRLWGKRPEISQTVRCRPSGRGERRAAVTTSVLSSRISSLRRWLWLTKQGDEITERPRSLQPDCRVCRQADRGEIPGRSTEPGLQRTAEESSEGESTFCIGDSPGSLQTLLGWRQWNKLRPQSEQEEMCGSCQTSWPGHWRAQTGGSFGMWWRVSHQHLKWWCLRTCPVTGADQVWNRNLILQ